MDQIQNSLLANNSSSQTGVAHQTSCVYGTTTNVHELTLEDFQLLMKKAARLGSIRFVAHMRKEGML